MIPIADVLYDTFINEIRKGGVDPMTGHRPFSDLTKHFTPDRLSGECRLINLELDAPPS
jgi:hypothetical protein